MIRATDFFDLLAFSFDQSKLLAGGINLSAPQISMICARFLSHLPHVDNFAFMKASAGTQIENS
jgi:hypothetical protein